MTRGQGVRLEDGVCTALLNAKAGAICFVAKSWDYHVRVALGTTLDENLRMIARLA